MSDRNLTRLKLGALLVGAALLYLIGNERVALWDRDEPRYAQTSRHMVESGNWVVPMFLDVVRTAKPIFIYWCQGGAMKLLGTNAFAARLPSAVAMIITLTMLAIVLWRAVGPQHALWSVFVLASSALTIAAAKMCLTDSVLLLFITIGQICLYAIWRGNRSWRIVIIMAIAVGLAGLTKGPVILGVLGMTVLGLAAFKCIDSRTVGATLASPSFPNRFRGTEGDASVAPTKFSAVARTLFFIVIVAAIVVPWILMVERQQPGFIMRSIRHDLIERAQGSLEGHKGPPGYYLLTVWGTYFPWSVLLPATLVLGWKQRANPHIRFALAAAIGPWVMFEIVQTKLPHYLLPCFAPLAFLTSDMLLRCIRGEYNDLTTTGAKVVFGIWAIVVVALGLTPWLAVRTFHPLPWNAMAALSMTAIVYATAVFVRFRNGDIARGAVAMGTGMMIVVAIAFAFYLPDAPFLRVSTRLADALVSHGATGAVADGNVVMIDYKEPSLAFYQSGQIRERDDGYLSTIPLERWPTWIVLTADVWRTMPDDVKRRLREIESFHGLAYADGGRVVEVKIVRKIDEATPAR